MSFDNGVLHTEKSCIFLTSEVGTSSICCNATTFLTSPSHLGPARLWVSAPLALPCSPFVHPAPLLPLFRFLYAHTFHSHYCFFRLDCVATCHSTLTFPPPLFPLLTISLL